MVIELDCLLRLLNAFVNHARQSPVVRSRLYDRLRTLSGVCSFFSEEDSALFLSCGGGAFAHFWLPTVYVRRFQRGGNSVLFQDVF